VVLLGNPKKHLRELSLGLLQNLTEAVVFRMSYVYLNLNILNLSGVSLAVTDNSLQMIFRHMTLLRSLNIDSCCKVNTERLSMYNEKGFTSLVKITDYGFTGVSSEYARRHHSIRNLKGLQILKCNGLLKVTDFTLIDGFTLLELKELYFSRCNVSFI